MVDLNVGSYWGEPEYFHSLVVEYIGVVDVENTEVEDIEMISSENTEVDSVSRGSAYFHPIPMGVLWEALNSHL